MSIQNSSKEIEELYAIIIDRFKKVESYYLSKGYMNQKVSFEDVDLEDLLEARLAPLFVSVLRAYPYPCTLKKQMSMIFVATLCEIAKRGLSQGGILKTLEEYIGFELDRNRYYRIIPEILREAKIEVVLETGKKYENAIICEAGIPRNLHSVVMKFFSIYWKWFKHVDQPVRHRELKEFLLSGNFTDEYIVDQSDFKTLKRVFEIIDSNNLSLKAIKSCIKLEEVFVQLDEYEKIITKDNVNEVCEFISTKLGYNILTIVNEQNLKSEVISYANKVSFDQFRTILNNVPSNEKIIIPTGKSVIKNQLSIDNLMCGHYKVREVRYEVTYPIPLGVTDLLCLEENKIYNVNGVTIYVSSYPFVVEIDERKQKTTRELCYKDRYLYVFAGKIGAAAIAYIDGIPINPLDDTRMIVGIRKKWDYDNQCNVLGISVSNFALYNTDYKMQTLSLRVNNAEKKKRINSHGYLQMQEQWFDITGTEESITVQASVGDMVLKSKEVSLPETVMFGKFTGMRVDKYIDLKKWYGDGSVVYFARSNVLSLKSVKLKKITNFGTYNVYEGIIDLSQDAFWINEQKYEIKHSIEPYLKLECEYEYISEKYIVKSFDDILIQINRGSAKEARFIIKAIHNDESNSISLNVGNVRTVRLPDIIKCREETSGKWELMLLSEQYTVDRLEFIIIPELKIVSEKSIVKKGETASFNVVADSNCFRLNERMIDTKHFSFESSYLIGLAGNNENVIQESIYIDSCDIYYPIEFPLNVWEAYIEINGKKVEQDSIDYNEIAESKLVIETNIKAILQVKASKENQVISVSQGRNLYDIKDFFNSFTQINELRIRDYNDAETVFKVIYSPKANLLNGYERALGAISFNVKYSGPIGVKMGIEIFEDYLRTKRIEISTDDNDGIYRIKIPDEKNISRDLSIEIDFNGRNKRSIGELHIKKIEPMQNIQLEKYKFIWDLIDAKPEPISLTTNLYDLLGIGRELS